MYVLQASEIEIKLFMCSLRFFLIPFAAFFSKSSAGSVHLYHSCNVKVACCLLLIFPLNNKINGKCEGAVSSQRNAHK